MYSTQDPTWGPTSAEAVGPGWGPSNFGNSLEIFIYFFSLEIPLDSHNLPIRVSAGVLGASN